MQIEKAKLERQFRRALFTLENQPDLEDFRHLLQGQYQRFTATFNEWSKLKQEGYEAKRKAFHKTVQGLDLRLRRVELRHRLIVQRKQWRILIDQLIAQPSRSLPPA